MQRLILSFAIASAIAGGTVHAQQNSPAPAASASPSASASPAKSAAAAAPTPIPLGEAAWQSEAVLGTLHEMVARSDPAVAAVNRRLPAFSYELSSRLIESSQMLTAKPPLEQLSYLESLWLNSTRTLSEWDHNLVRSATESESNLQELSRLETVWAATLKSAEDAHAPEETIRRIGSVLEAIRSSRNQVAGRLKQILTTQDQVAGQNARVAAALLEVRHAREQALARVFIRDGEPIWNGEVSSAMGSDLMQKSHDSFESQFAMLVAYASRESGRFLCHAGLVVFLIFAFRWARQRTQEWAKEDPSLQGEALVFANPLATAVVVSVLFDGLIYPEAPRMLHAILGAAALIPAFLILRRLIAPTFIPILKALVVFYFLDQFRSVAASLSQLPRWVFMLELIGSIAFLVWLLQRYLRRTETIRFRAFKRVAASVALLLFLVALGANIFGYVGLAYILGNAVLRSAYVAMFLAAIARILDGVTVIALKVRPLCLLQIVKRHWQLLHRRTNWAIRFAAVTAWLYMTLQHSVLSGAILRAINAIVSVSIVMGSVKFSIGNLLAFGLTIWAAFLVSRFARFLLDEDIYQRFHLARGLPYAISTVLNYLILLIGFFLALAALGVDMTRFTILAGAFSVGIGFGLQNVINNFVSGLILLFERPIKVGDVVQIDASTGVVQRIGIRASIVRTPDGAEIIVPNGNLISNNVTNWTFSDRRRAIQIPVTASRGADPVKVIDLVKKLVASNEKVARQPAPQVYFSSVTGGVLNFELRAWTDQYEDWVRIRSDLALAINAALVKENLAS
jgi:potassium-dependent mechanosensitive channel